MSDSLRRVAVIGAGAMGTGIAQVTAMAGWPTALTDARPAALAAARDTIAAQLAGAVDRDKLTREESALVLERTTTPDTVAETCAGADLIIEAVVEDLAVKREVVAEAARHAAPGALVASNTSSLSIAAIAEAVPLPERCVGLHFFNPVHIMKLVEIVVHEGVTEGTRAEAVGLVRAMGKEPIVVRDSPGFASSRLGIALGMEAIRMVEQQVATAEDIDKAMELGYKHPMGPLRLTDLVGLDVRLKIAEYLHETLGGAHFEPPDLLRRMVAEGRLGKKTGIGFYDWS